MEVFLRAKAWKLFVLMFGIPLGFYFILMDALASSNNQQLVSWFTSVLAILFNGVLVAWMWALGTRLYLFTPEEIRISPSRFKFGLIYASVWMLVCDRLFTYMASGDQLSGHFAMIFIPHVLAMFFILYATCYIAKHLVMAEKRKVVSFRHFLGSLFLLPVLHLSPPLSLPLRLPSIQSPSCPA